MSEKEDAYTQAKETLEADENMDGQRLHHVVRRIGPERNISELKSVKIVPIQECCIFLLNYRARLVKTNGKLPVCTNVHSLWREFFR